MVLPGGEWRCVRNLIRWMLIIIFASDLVHPINTFDEANKLLVDIETVSMIIKDNNK